MRVRLPKNRWLKILVILLLAPYVLAIPYLIVPPVSTLMLADLATLTLPKRDWVPLEKMSPQLVAAVLATEDSAFCDHFGFDFRQIEKSIDRAVDGGSLRGASTITQQTAKNLFLWNGRSWIRKALEVPITLWLEIWWPKRRVLEVYMNIAEWGPGIYGAEAAAKHYFGVSAKSVSLYQAALLATTLANPAARSPTHPGPVQSAASTVVAKRVQGNGPDLSCVRKGGW